MRTITYTNAKIIGVEDGYGVGVGDRADLVVLDAPDATTALLDRAVRTAVIKAGKVVARTEKHTQTIKSSGHGSHTRPWRGGSDA
jgi:cytosine deaminase